MEVFIRDEYIKYAVVDKSEFEPYSFLLESYDKIEVKSIEQHDAKIKAKWCDEIMEFINKNEYCVGDYNIENHYAIATDILKQKLNEMKGATK